MSRVRCDGVTRREFLRLGGLTALGLSLSDALRLRAQSGVNTPARPPRCILLWLDGGPSHLDTFDLKPDAPAEIRGDFRPAATNLPGVHICEHFPRLAQMMDKVCLIRSVTSELGEHNFGTHYLLTGYKPTPVLDYPSYGSVIAHCRGSREDLLPPHIAIPHYPPQGPLGYLPATTRPFAVGGDPSKPDFRVRDLDPDAELVDRLDRRKEFLQAFDKLSRQVEESPQRATRDAFFEQAYRLLTSKEVKKAFDLSQERAKVRERYGHHRLGQSCLLARRLIDAGCPFVTVTDTGWDTHQNIYRELREGYAGGKVGRVPLLDQALAALLEDLAQSGLLKETLVVVMGEFGRTPKLNSAGGRDHWPRAFSVLLAGSGVKAGQVIGKSDARGESPADRPVTPADLARTIYTLLHINPDRELHTSDGRPVKIVADGEVVRDCFA